MECSKQIFIRLAHISMGQWKKTAFKSGSNLGVVMIDRGEGGGWYSAARGEILRFAADSRTRSSGTESLPEALRPVGSALSKWC